MDLTLSRNRRRVLFALLYLAEGAPIGFIWWALPAKLRDAGVPVGTITLMTSVIILPWAFKFLWAPLVDVLRGPKWGRRGWVVSAQLLMGLSLLPLAILEWDRSLGLLFGLLLIHAFAAATQDVAIDAWAISVTPAHELGRINGWMQTGMLVGRWLFGAGFLIVAHRVDDPSAVIAMVGIIWATTLVVFLASDRDQYNESDQFAASVRMQLSEFLATLRRVLRRTETWLGIGFALVAFAGFKAVGDLAGPFLIDRGLAQSEVGHFYTGALLAMIVGALAGGWAADRFGNAPAIRAFVLITVLVVLATSGAAWLAEATRLFAIIGLLAVYLCAGMLTASCYALLMQLTDPKLGATQFSAYMGAINGCEAWSGFFAGQLAEHFSYSIAFVSVALVSLLALPLLGRIMAAGSAKLVQAACRNDARRRSDSGRSTR